MDPNSDLGESVAALAIQFESLFKTIFGQDATIATVFEIAGVALGIFLDLMHDLLRILETIIIFFQVMGEAMTLFFTDIEKFFQFDQGEELKRRLDIRYTVNNNKLAVKQYIAEWDRVRALNLSGHISEVSMTADSMERLARASASVRPMLTGTADSMERQINAMNRATQATVAAVATVRSSLGSSGVSTPSAAAVSADNAQSDSARELQRALDDAARTEEERLNRREAAYKSFADSVKSTFGSIKESILSAFSLPDLGNSVNSITRNIQKLLTRTKEFARNITSLSQQGLTNDLLQQVIAAGPIQGGRLAQSLAGAGGGFISQLNQAYGEFGGIASGIAGVGASSAFANREVINNYYQIEVSGGVGSGPTIGKAIVDAIKSYERTSGAVWQGA
jgi:hypothetical protein